MKRIAILMLAAGMFSLVACGPSAEEKAAAEQRITDSIAAVDAARVQDSIAAAEMAAQAMMDAQKAVDDSMKMVAMQDSIDALKVKAKKPASKPKTKEEKQQKKDQEELKKVNSGRG